MAMCFLNQLRLDLNSPSFQLLKFSLNVLFHCENTNTPPLVSPFRMSKDITGSDIVKQNVSQRHMKSLGRKELIISIFNEVQEVQIRSLDTVATHRSGWYVSQHGIH